MNYRHSYHAGSFADVFKHSILALIVEALKRKDAAFCVLDTHAGIGRYDLLGPDAGKTGEALAGVRRLEGRVPPVEAGPYWGAVKSLNHGEGAIRWYPGSPRVVRHLLRPQDRLLLAELHPEDADALTAEFARDPQVQVRHLDGYAALRALLPPDERRGLVLIDPPFEDKGEFAAVLHGLKDAWRRWPSGTYAIWYPIKSLQAVNDFHRAIAGLAPGPTLAAQLLVHPATSDERLNGCGLVIVRPPWKLDEPLAHLLPFLHAVLRQSGGGTDMKWLVQEKDRET